MGKFYGELQVSRAPRWAPLSPGGEKCASSPGLEPGTPRLQGEYSPYCANRAAIHLSTNLV
ncbi:hypothetical protein DPMN_172205 [Dreissena polymorpha]|uniref:Uncharacterized protein n=1 Tax=Dreissena polymorpha TaxID=45954 RepID=A0A9D4DZE3_DREPO|nr:hypothetical protein DPMN_172205 [Dreissena polymorpha]